jgi:7-carboxy-7-deazaguanine synthase
MVYNVSEIFYSIQGEGIMQGLPMVFIRMAGCNLRCSFCDTKYAFKNGERTGVRKILDKIKKYPCKRACITGGEPFLQNLTPLVKELKRKKYWLTAETNGTLWQDIPLDWLTVSPKTDGKKLHPQGYDRKFLRVASEFKYVITCKDDLDFIDKKIKKPVVLQPVDNNTEIAKEITIFLKENAGRNWYLRMQMHKITGIR